MKKQEISVKLSRRDIAYIMVNIFLDTPTKQGHIIMKKLENHLDFTKALKIYEKVKK